MTGQGDRAYIDSLVRFIEGRAAEIQANTRVVSTIDLVVLTLLNVADEMFRLRQSHEETIKALEEKTEKLLKAKDRSV